MERKIRRQNFRSVKKIGASLDWSRTRFTMDKNYSEAVKTAFLHYHKKDGSIGPIESSIGAAVAPLHCPIWSWNIKKKKTNFII